MTQRKWLAECHAWLNDPTSVQFKYQDSTYWEAAIDRDPVTRPDLTWRIRPATSTIELMLKPIRTALEAAEALGMVDEYIVGLRAAIAAGEAELRRKATAIVCDCEGTTDDDGKPLHYALLYLDHPLSAGTELYLREETK